MRARDAALTDGANQKPVSTGREVGIVDCLLLGRRAPILVGAFEHVLVTQRLARFEINAEKIYLQIVLCVRQLEVCNLGDAKLWQRTTLARNAKAAQPDAWRG